MLDVWITGLIIGGLVLAVALFAAFMVNVIEGLGQKEKRQVASGMFLGTVGVVFWPLLLPLALLAFLGYGGFTTARAVKNRSFDFN